jgi:hypothetical protein
MVLELLQHDILVASIARKSQVRFAELNYHFEIYLFIFLSFFQVNMIPAELAVQSTSNVIGQFSQFLATESDFGGYAGPAGSLILIGFLILTLAPPLAEKDNQ